MSDSSRDKNDSPLKVEDPKLQAFLDALSGEMGRITRFMESFNDRLELQEQQTKRHDHNATRRGTTRARPSTTPIRFQTPEDEEVDNPDHYFRDLNNKLGRVQGRKSVDYLNRYPITKDERKTILTPVWSEEVYVDQYKKQGMRLEGEKKEKESENKMSENTQSEYKKKEGQEKEKHVSLNARTSEDKHALYNNLPILVPLCKGDYLATNDLNPSLPSVFVDLLQDFEHVVPEEIAQSSCEGEKVVLAPLTPQEVNIDQKKLLEREKEEFTDVFLEELPSGLPPLRGIEHQIDFILGSTIPNQPVNRSNPMETKVLQRHIQVVATNGVQYGLKRRRRVKKRAWILRRSGLILASKRIPQLLTKIRGRIFLRKGGMIWIHWCFLMGLDVFLSLVACFGLINM